MNDRQRLEAIIAVVCKYLPPDGIPINDAMSEIISLVDPLPPQPEQEPNWAWICNECGAQEFTKSLCKADLDYLACTGCGSSEFHREALAQEQEPVADDFFRMIADRNPKPFPPLQRIWVGLTDEEISELSKGHIVRSTYARAIEARLKDKNT